MATTSEDLTEAAKQALCGLVDDVPDEAVLEYAATQPDLLAGGMRAVRGNAGVLRARLRSRLARARQLDAPLRTWLARNSLQQDLVVVLSEIALVEAFPHFAAYFGPSRFAAALLLDERPGVQKRALEYFRDHPADEPAPTAAERAQAAARLEEVFERFLGRLSELEAAESEPAASPDAGRLGAELRAAREELNRVQGLAARSEKAAARELEKLRAANASLALDLAAARERARAAAEEKRQGEGELAGLRGDFDRLVRERLATELSARLRPWLEPVRALEGSVRSADAAAGGEDDLLLRAAAALGRQAETDRHFGNRTRAQRRLRALESVLADIDSARREAFHPLPELDSLAAEAERELQGLRASLSLSEPPGALGQTLARIQALGGLDEVEEFRRFLDTAADLRAWEAADLRALYAKLDQQFSRLMEPYIASGARPAGPRTPLAALRQALARDEECVLLVDGHNVLPGFFAPLYEGGRPGPRAREGLIQELVRMFAGSTRARARLYFDSDEPTRSEPSDQVVVLFSGGEGRDRADNAILADLERFVEERAAAPRFLVSSDAGLVRQARELGAVSMRSAEFAVLFRGEGG